jgi:TRAP-type C4-dicarboxylate transport system substrate-binding protein
MIDTVYISPMACVGLQWFTKVKYMTDYPVTNSVGAVIVSKKAWDKIPAETRPVVKKICDKHFKRLAEATMEDNEKSMETLKKNGIRFVPVTQEGIEQFHQVSMATRKRLAGVLYPQELQNRVEKILAEYRIATGEKE